jgi:endonuclease YncB( thermonuclease family)
VVAWEEHTQGKRPCGTDGTGHSKTQLRSPYTYERITRLTYRAEQIHVRIAGIDAPELAHFGRPAQPFGKEALEFLTSYLINRRVRVQLWRRDQYERVVATVHVRRGIIPLKRDVSLEMLRRGLATVYEAKFGAEFGDMEAQYREAEAKAKSAGIGLWKERSIWQKMLGKEVEQRESPREYKTRMAKEEKDRAEKS